MGKIHVLLKKEELNKEKLQGDKLVVVFDVLLATSTITTALQYGARNVIPVLNGEEAKRVARSQKKDSYLLVGEYEGLPLDGFHSPNPNALRGKVYDKTMILSTTNGTVAIRNSISAKFVFVASLLNSRYVAEQLIKHFKNETIILVCSGSSGSFNAEDFYGAGHFIHSLHEQSHMNWTLSDSAFAAYEFYKGKQNVSKEVLKASRVGQMLTRFGFEEELAFVSQQDVFPVVPYVNDDTFVVAEQYQKKRREIHGTN
ncbi:2-phosphosulfolactate phosphatase [Salinibacillus kushneri]|uniref:Probable 2-phosphosulfolactate phosphatase n=1 Tax=Salinibacillus kushneri TaxID=237682 RepID=A0A1I0DR01_9BACI|nr:2-phosphosulfolactate phosphatase [Salinibacillus kushneri]SET34986.1 2-phosphosulfolactate phosphatase [Salinibacillus kushneri]